MSNTNFALFEPFKLRSPHLYGHNLRNAQNEHLRDACMFFDSVQFPSREGLHERVLEPTERETQLAMPMTSCTSFGIRLGLSLRYKWIRIIVVVKSRKAHMADILDSLELYVKPYGTVQ